MCRVHWFVTQFHPLFMISGFKKLRWPINTSQQTNGTLLFLNIQPMKEKDECRALSKNSFTWPVDSDWFKKQQQKQIRLQKMSMLFINVGT